MPDPLPQFSQQQKRDFCLMISVGCDRETACKYWGWTAADLHRVLDDDHEFARQLLRAEGTAEFAHMRNLHNAAKEEKNWRVSVWWLERRSPERFARRAPNVLTATQMSAIIEELADGIAEEITNQDDRRRLLNRLAQIGRAMQHETFEAADTNSSETVDG